jgi:SurA N-terminal domain
MKQKALLLICVVAGVTGWAQVLDSLAATVNGHAILQSDWSDELRYECFISGKPQHDLMPEDRRAVLERLIDQELLREQTSSTDFKSAGADEINAQLEVLKKQYPQEHGGESWDAALTRNGISESDVTAHIALELNALRLVDARLRPLIQIDFAEVRDYYNKEVLPKSAEGSQTSLREAAPKIRELLVQKKMNEALGSWLESLRTQAQIHILAPPPSESQVKP